MKSSRVFLALLVLVSTWPAYGFWHGSIGATSFNGGKFQLNTNFTGIGGDYPFVNWFKNTSGNWSLADNQGMPSPTDVDANGYLLPGSNAITAHSGAIAVVRIPAQAYVGNNCLAGTNGTGICTFLRMNGIGTVYNPGTPITSSTSTATVTTGSTTTISFSGAQDFRAGMEVPISGTTGVTATNGGGGSLTGGGTSGAWTVCAAGLTTTTIQLCLNDQVTPLTTTGTAGGTTVVTYGRNACGVTASCRIVSAITNSPVSVNVGIKLQDAATPITYRNGIDGIAFGLQGSEEVRLEKWLAGTCPGGYNPACQFSSQILSKLAAVKPGVIRALDWVNSNTALDVHWADRMPISYYSYGADQFDRRGTSVYAGATTSVLNDYSVSLGSGGPADGQQVSILFDAAAVTVTSGAGALVTWTSHGLSNGQPIYFTALNGGSLPGGTVGPTTGGNSAPNGGAPSGYTYFAITTCGSCNANTIQFATTLANANAGTAVTTSSTGTNVLAHSTVVPGTVTFTSSSANLTWAGNGPVPVVGDPVSINGGSYPFNPGVSYCVKTVVGSVITVAATCGGTALVSASGASGTVGAVRNPTLNLNSSGAVAIMGTLGTGVGTTKSEQPVARADLSLDYGVLTYDGVLNVWIKKGADSSIGRSLFTSGWPPEIFLQFATAIGAHPWYSPPQFTVDGAAGITNYNTSLYNYVHVNGPSWMIPRFEVLPNEFWNGQFAATTSMTYHSVVYAGNAGWTQNIGIFQIAGKIASVLGQAVNNEYGGAVDGTKYQTIVGVQTFTFSQASGAANNAPRLTSTDYIAQSTPAQSPYTKSAAYNWATHVACAQYFTPGYYGTSFNTALAAANAGGAITGSISGNQLTVTSVRVVTSPVFGTGSTLVQGPGVVPGTVISSGAASPYTLDRTYANPVGSTNINYLASGYDTTAAQTFIDSATNNATFTGSISGAVLTASSVTGSITTGSGSGGDFIMGSGVPGFLQISSQSSGTTGKDGNYNLSGSGGTVTSRAMTSNSVFSLPSENLMYAAVFAFAQTYTNSGGVKLKMNGYEGGYSPDYTSSGLSLTDRIAAAGKTVTSSPGSVTGIYGYVLTNAQNFKAAGGEFPSLFQFTGISPSNNAWSAIDDIYQPSPTPILDAYRDYN
jgi:hypothetical protein